MGRGKYRNGLKTVILMGALSALILVAGTLIGGRSGLQIAFIFALVTNGIGYFSLIHGKTDILNCQNLSIGDR